MYVRQLGVLLIEPCCPAEVVDIDCFSICSVLLEQINDDEGAAG